MVEMNNNLVDSEKTQRGRYSSRPAEGATNGEPLGTSYFLQGSESSALGLNSATDSLLPLSKVLK